MCMCYVILSACKEAYADSATITDLQVLHAVLVQLQNNTSTRSCSHCI